MRLLALVAALSWFGTVYYAAHLRGASYSHFAHYVSALAADDCPLWTRTGIFFLPGGAMAVAGLRGRMGLGSASELLLALSGIARVLSGWWPCDANCAQPGSATQHLHMAAALAGSVLLALAAHQSTRRRQFSRACAATAVLLLLVGGVGRATVARLGATGFVQRLTLGTLFLWLAAISLW